MLTAERLRELLHYDPVTGLFTRRVTTGGRYGAKAGTVAGTFSDQGYWMVSVCSKQYRAHRLAVLYVTGAWPAGEVDHKNGERADNRWGNLRDVPTAINAQNKRRAARNSKTGLLGVSWCKKDKRFVARLKVNGVYRYLGGFHEPETANAAYLQAKRQHHAGCTI